MFLFTVGLHEFAQHQHASIAKMVAVWK